MSEQQKSNPWSESTEEGHIKKDTVQMVQNLPPILAEDVILQNILKPTGQFEQVEKYPNVVPLAVNFGGQETKQVDGKKMATIDVHKDKKVEYDPDKGFVSSTWANFELDPKCDQVMTSDPKGIFIKHLTSTVINPNMLSKGIPISEADMKSLTFTSGNLVSNAWSNALLYKPKEQLFKFDHEKQMLVPQTENEDTGSSSR